MFIFSHFLLSELIELSKKVLLQSSHWLREVSLNFICPKVHTRLRRVSRAFVKCHFQRNTKTSFFFFVLPLSSLLSRKFSLANLSLVLLFGLLISQRPRMLDFCPLIEFSIFISLGIFKVVLLFNYQYFVRFFRNSLYSLSNPIHFVKNFFIIRYYFHYELNNLLHNYLLLFISNVLYIITRNVPCQ